MRREKLLFFFHMFESKQAALSHLSKYITGEQSLKQGPIQVDSNSFSTINGLKKAAAYYYQAFTSGVKTFPYIITG